MIMVYGGRSCGKTYAQEILNRTFYLDNIPFVPLAKRGNAVNCRIGMSQQLVFIPVKFFNKDLTLKENANLLWFLDKPDTKHKIELYKREIGEQK